jgi:hypothetical protein
METDIEALMTSHLKPCPHCGCVGYHMWAGSGQCPGVQDNLKSLLSRAADALENANPGWPKFHAGLIAELRKAAQ